MADGTWISDAQREIADLPLYTFTRDGEPEMQPCGERVLTESDIQHPARRGIGADRQPSRSQCGGPGSGAVDIAAAGAAHLVTVRSGASRNAAISSPLRTSRTSPTTTGWFQVLPSMPGNRASSVNWSGVADDQRQLAFLRQHQQQVLIGQQHELAVAVASALPLALAVGQIDARRGCCRRSRRRGPCGRRSR